MVYTCPSGEEEEEGDSFLHEGPSLLFFWTVIMRESVFIRHQEKAGSNREGDTKITGISPFSSPSNKVYSSIIKMKEGIKQQIQTSL